MKEDILVKAKMQLYIPTMATTLQHFILQNVSQFKSQQDHRSRLKER